MIDNAIKYSPNNNDIFVKVYDTEGRTIVSVTSTGPKLLDGESERIFENGYRGENAIKARNSGTGIGLSVAKEIIGIFNGKIWVRRSKSLGQIVNKQYEDIT